MRGEINLVPVHEYRGAVKVLYEMLRERSEEADEFVNISHRALPAWREHCAFVRRRPYRAWYLILGPIDLQGPERSIPSLVLGQIYATRLNEIGIILLRAHRGKGIGSEAVKAITQRHKPLAASAGRRAGHWLANINPKNERSIRLFEGLGFKHIQNTYQL